MRIHTVNLKVPIPQELYDRAKAVKLDVQVLLEDFIGECGIEFLEEQVEQNERD